MANSDLLKGDAFVEGDVWGAQHDLMWPPHQTLEYQLTSQCLVRVGWRLALG